MNKSHIKSTLALKGVSHPIDSNTRALFHFNNHAYDHTGTIRPLGVYPDIEEGLIGCWNFSDKQEVAYDLSGNDNHGTIVGATWGNGRNGKALSFDGVDDYALVNNLDISLPCSVSLWVRVSEIPTDSQIIFYHSASGIGLGFHKGNFILASRSNNAQRRCNLSGFSVNGWNHIAINYSEQNVPTVRINGSEPGYLTNDYWSSEVDSNFYIGRRGTNFFKGQVSNISVYSRALSEEEIQAHYNEGIYTIRPDGKYGGAIAVENETQNYLSQGYNGLAPSRWVYGENTGYDVDGYDVFYFNGATTKYVYSQNEVLNPFLADLSSRKVTFSTYIRSTNGTKEVQLKIYDNVTSYTTVTLPVSSDFRRLSASKTLGANPSRIFVMVDGDGEYEFYKPQLEKGSFPTSFVDGAREEGKIIYNIPLGIEWTFSEYVKNVNSMEE